jgi:transcriptional regulator of nitric oxide reductase
VSGPTLLRHWPIQANPELIASSAAIDHDWNRLLSNGVIIRLLVAGAFANFFGKSKKKAEEEA